MTVESLIAELQTYDPNLPIVLHKEGRYRSLSFYNVTFKEDVMLNDKETDAIVILGYDD